MYIYIHMYIYVCVYMYQETCGVENEAPAPRFWSQAQEPRRVHLLQGSLFILIV